MLTADSSGSTRFLSTLNGLDFESPNQICDPLLFDLQTLLHFVWHFPVDMVKGFACTRRYHGTVRIDGNFRSCLMDCSVYFSWFLTSMTNYYSFTYIRTHSKGPIRKHNSFAEENKCNNVVVIYHFECDGACFACRWLDCVFNYIKQTMGKYRIGYFV